MPKDDGYSGVAFKYKDSLNFYSLELHLEKESSFCKIRITKQGISQLIMENKEDCSKLIQKEKWITVTIEMKENQISIVLSQDQIKYKIFNVSSESEKEKHNKVSLLSYNSKVAFSNFQMMPSEDLLLKEGNFKMERQDLKNNSNYDQTCFVENIEERDQFCKKNFANRLGYLSCKVKNN